MINGSLVPCDACKRAKRQMPDLLHPINNFDELMIKHIGYTVNLLKGFYF